MIPRRFLAGRGERGSTSLVALVTIASLTFIAGSFIVRITARSKEGFQSASWVEAAQGAESGAAFGLAEIRRVVPDTVKFPADAWTGWTATSRATGLPTLLPLSSTIPADTILAKQNVTLTHVGEGNQTTSTDVQIDAPASLVDSAGQQWLRIRATGTAGIPRSSRASLSAAARQLRRLAFVRDGLTGQAVATPQVSRNVEWIAQPVPPFPGALQSPGAISGSGGSVTVDSYDSTSTAKSTSGEYDSAKRQANGDIFTSTNSLALTGTVSGDVSTNNYRPGGSLTISGVTDTTYYSALAPISAPDWGILNYYSFPIYANTNASTNSTGSPTLYHLSSITATLTLKANKAPNGSIIPSKVILWVDGDITGAITVENGVQATIYAGGNIDLKSTELVNASHQPANLQIYGISSSSNPFIKLAMSSDVYAAIYAPGHDISLTGGNNGDFMGALTGESITLKGNRRIHYDESLAKRATVIVDYRLTSWIEDVH